MSLTDLTFQDPKGLVNRAAFNERFSMLNQLMFGLGNQYIWEKMKAVVNVGNPSTITSASILYNGTDAQAEYSTEVIIENGEIVLKDPIVVSFSELSQLGDSLKGKYYQALTDPGSTIFSIGQVIYIDVASAIVVSTNNVSINRYSNPTIQYVSYGFVNSSDENAYPPVTPDEYEYFSLGQLGSKVGIETGSYTGTGTYGGNNPNSLTFGFEPQIVVIGSNSSLASNASYCVLSNNGYFCPVFSGFGGGVEGVLYGVVPTFNARSVFWFSSSNAVRQLNASGITYNYIALG